MTSSSARWPPILGFTVTACLGVAALGQAQFSSFSDRSRAVFEGNWQSCRASMGRGRPAYRSDSGRRITRGLRELVHLAQAIKIHLVFLAELSNFSTVVRHSPDISGYNLAQVKYLPLCRNHARHLFLYWG